MQIKKGALYGAFFVSLLTYCLKGRANQMRQ